MIHDLPPAGCKYTTQASIPAGYLQTGQLKEKKNLTSKFIHRGVQLEVMESDIENYTKVKTLGKELLLKDTNVFYISHEVLLHPLNGAFLKEAKRAIA